MPEAKKTNDDKWQQDVGEEDRLLLGEVLSLLKSVWKVFKNYK